MHGERRPSAEEEALLSAYEADDATPDERARAQRLLDESSEARAVLERLRALRAATPAWADALLPDASRQRVFDAVARPRRRLRVAALVALPAVATFALILGLSRRTRDDQAVVPPTPTEIVQTGVGEYRLLPLGDRGVAFVGEQAEVLPGRGPLGLEVRRGSVRLVIRRDPRQARKHPFIVATPAAEVAVLGTEFDVSVTGDTTEVRVVRGEVEVRNARGTRLLWADETARARLGESPRLVQPLRPVILDGPAEIVPPPPSRKGLR